MDELDTSVKSEPDDEEGSNRFPIVDEKMEDCQGTLGPGRTCLFCTETQSKRLCDIDDLPSLQGSQGNSLVNHHLWSVFILRNLLQYPKGKVTKLLKKRREIPLEDWFDLCESCVEIVREAMIVFEKLLKLATQFKNFKKQVKWKIQDSLRGDQDGFGGAASVGKEIRKYFKDSSVLNPTVAEPTNRNVLNADIKEENDIPNNRPNSIGGVLELQNENDEYEDEPVFRTPGDHDDYSYSCDETDPLYIPAGVTAKVKSTRKSSKPRYPKLDGKTSKKRKLVGNQLRDLFSQVNNIPKPFPCKICLCDRKYATKSSYNLHMKQHRLNKYPCRKCKYPYSSASRMKSHLKKCSYNPQDNQNTSVSPEDAFKENSSSDNEDDEEWPLVNDNEDDDDVNDETCLSTSTTQITSISVDMKKKLSKSETKEIYCKLCLTKRTFANVSLYNKHKRLHRICKYPCPKCRYPCQTELSLERHLKRKMCNNQTIIYKCEFCDFETRTSSEYLEHMNMHRQEQKNKKLDTSRKLIKDGKIYCTLCVGQRQFKCSKYYAKHLLHHKFRKYPCPKCRYPCKSEKHLEIHKSRGGRCSFSEKKQQKREREMREKKEKRKQYHCNLCDFGPETYTAMEKHKKNVHKRVLLTNEQKRLKRREWERKRMEKLTTFFSCHLCPFKTKLEKSMNVHIKKHELFDGEKIDGKLKCKFCDDLFPGPLSLKRHVRGTHTEKMDQPLFKCSFCGINLCQKDSLRNHIEKVHFKQCAYYCEICGYGTMTKYMLSTHMQQHNPVRSFVCELCAATFRTARSLGTHMTRVHNPTRKEVTVICKYCSGNDKDKSFSNKSLLNRHMTEVHKDLYVHKCDKCERSYLSVASLQLHKKINHGGEEKAECQFCQAKVLNRVYLYTHYRNCHKTPPDFKYTYPRK